MTEEQKDLYFTALRESGLEATSAKQVGVTLTAVRREYELDESFREQCFEAKELMADKLEKEAQRRALEGTTKGIYYQGSHVADETVFSDALLTHLLKGRRPEVFGDKRHLTGDLGGAIQVVIQEFDTDEPDFL